MIWKKILFQFIGLKNIFGLEIILQNENINKK